MFYYVLKNKGILELNTSGYDFEKVEPSNVHASYGTFCPNLINWFTILTDWVNQRTLIFKFISSSISIQNTSFILMYQVADNQFNG